jgi:NADPH:quinone reductase-like Zn-dependent oxidoreductase
MPDVPNTMRAAVIHEFGAPEVFRMETVPVPMPKGGEVLVRVEAAGVNPVDWKARRGVSMGLKLPAVMGWDVAGTVAAVGEGVSEWKAGDRVFGMVNFPDHGGGYAEYVAAPAGHLSRMPGGLDTVTAAAAPLAALTAWQGLFEHGDVRLGSRVLIQAAAGGVGHLAVQLASETGAHVIGTASARNAGFVKELGANEVVDYHATRFEDVVRNVDLVLEGTGDQDVAARCVRTLSPTGHIVTLASSVDVGPLRALGARAERMIVHAERAHLDAIAERLDDGRLRVEIDRVFPLEDVVRAHEHSESGHARGKIVLRVSA